MAAHLCMLRRPAADSMDKYQCLDCRENTCRLDEYYMVRHALWESAVPERRGFLCIGCLEARVGRRLTPDDFPDLPCNRTDGDSRFTTTKSPRLLDRLGCSV
jgi:hypothetical protein